MGSQTYCGMTYRAGNSSLVLDGGAKNWRCIVEHLQPSVQSPPLVPNLGARTDLSICLRRPTSDFASYLQFVTAHFVDSVNVQHH